MMLCARLCQRQIFQRHWKWQNLNRRSVPVRSSSNSTSKSQLSDFYSLLKLWGPEKGKMMAAVGLLFVSSGISMTVPFALGKVIDFIYIIDRKSPKMDDSSPSDEQKDGVHLSREQEQPEEQAKKQLEGRLRNFCAALAGIFLLGGACNFGRVYLMRVAGQNIAARLRRRLYAAIMRQRISFFDQNKTGELVNRLSADSQLVTQTITQQVSDGLRSTVMTASGVGMMFFMSPHLALVGLSVVPPVAIWAVFMGRRVKSYSKQVQDSLASATECAEERISNIRTVNAFAKERQEVIAYDNKMDQVLSVSEREAMVHAKFYGMTGLSGNMIILSVLYYGGFLVTSDALTVGNLASFVLYAAYVGIGLSGVSTFYAEMMKGLGASSRIFEIINSAPSPRPDVEKVRLSDSSVHLTGDIVFRDVVFSYPTRPDTRILDGLSCIVPAQKTLAIVGESGSGKSTLGSLLLRLYDPASGSISIGGMEIANMDEHQLRRQIGTVAQEPVLFSSSIRENILYGSIEEGREDSRQSAVEECAREANAHDFISTFPEGYETLVGERGILLSGGQKQRIAIARAIIRNPNILILDEATSALDAASESLVKEALQRIMAGRTVITIAHRLSTVMNADKIIVLQKGKIVESGTFEELVTVRGGYFNQLVEKQSIAK